MISDMISFQISYSYIVVICPELITETRDECRKQDCIPKVSLLLWVSKTDRCIDAVFC